MFMESKPSYAWFLQIERDFKGILAWPYLGLIFVYLAESTGRSEIRKSIVWGQIKATFSV